MNRRVFLLPFLMSLATDISAQGTVKAVQWHVAGSIPSSSEGTKPFGLAGAIAGRVGNVLIIAGGCNFPDSMPWLGGKKKYYDDVFVFEKKNESFRLLYSTKLPFKIAYSASCTTVHGVFFAGGENETGILKQAALIQWDNTKKRISLRSLADLPFPLTNASVVCVNDKIFLCGGESSTFVSNRLLTIDLAGAGGSWNELSLLPHPVSHAALISIKHGKKDWLYMIGGRRKRPDSTSQLYATHFSYDVSTNRWHECVAMPYALSAGTGIGANGNCILLFGGDRGEIFHQTEELILAIKKETDEKKKQELNKEKIELQSNHPGFSTSVLLFDIASNRWSTLDSVPFAVPVTTTAVPWGDYVLIPGGEIKAGVRSANILAGKIIIKK